MARLTVTDKGEVTLDRECLDLIHAKPGDKLDVVAMPGGTLRIEPARPEPKGEPGEKRGLEAFFGSIENRGGRVLTIDEMQEEIEKAWAGEP